MCGEKMCPAETLLRLPLISLAHIADMLHRRHARVGGYFDNDRTPRATAGVAVYGLLPI